MSPLIVTKEKILNHQVQVQAEVAANNIEAAALSALPSPSEKEAEYILDAADGLSMMLSAKFNLDKHQKLHKLLT